jgi:hypothetical protein
MKLKLNETLQQNLIDNGFLEANNIQKETFGT